MRVVGGDVPAVIWGPTCCRTCSVAAETQVEKICVGADVWRREAGRSVARGEQGIAAKRHKRRLRVEGIVVRRLVPAEGQVVGAGLVNIEAKRLVIPADVLAPGFDVERIRPGPMRAGIEVAEHAGSPVFVAEEFAQSG